jgi:subtilase family serine protease
MGQRGRLLGRVSVFFLLGTAGLSASADSVTATTIRARHGSQYEVVRLCTRGRAGHASCLSIGRARTSSAAPFYGASQDSKIIFPYSELPPGTLTPETLRSAYSLPAETPASHLQTIAIVDAYGDPPAERDLAKYDEQFGLPPCTTKNGCFRKVNAAGAKRPLPEKEPGWDGETALDLEMAHAVCQSCRLLLVEANTSSEANDPGAGADNLADAENTAAKLGATEISDSFVTAEVLAAESKEYPGDFPSAGWRAAFDHPGVAITAGSGDCGYLDEATLSFCPEEPKRANFPSSSPDVVSVGGTQLAESGGEWSATAWKEAGSGCSIFFSAPPWQSAVSNFSATGCGGARAVSDVSANAGDEPGVAVYLSVPFEKGEEVGWYHFYGTSVATPILAAEFGLAGGSHGVAYPAKTLYSHAGSSSDIYDVTTGSNGSCAGASICNAGPGYDGPTGLGSPTGLGGFQVSGAPEATSEPAISGVVQRRQTLTVLPATWSSSPTVVSDQWARCDETGTYCAPIEGATGSTYNLKYADRNHAIRVQETASNGAGGSAPAVSSPTAVVP